MNVQLYIMFDIGLPHLADFIIENPPVLPNSGEIFGAKWSDYIKHKKDLKFLEENKEEISFIAEIISKDYSKEEVRVLIVLHRSESYRKRYPSSKR